MSGPDVHVVCAHESASILESMRAAVEQSGFAAITTDDGDEVMRLLREPVPPALLVVDVALPGRAGFEIIDEIRKLNLPTRTILVASVYSQTGYKRRPASLYGADDYIEQHHIEDGLPQKIEALLPRPAQQGSDRPTRPAASAARPGPQGADERADERLSFGGGESSQDVEFRAQRLAWLIVADVLLYNGDGISELQRTGVMSPRVRRDLDEGRALFALRVPEGARGQRDWIGEALEQFLAGRRRV